LLLEWYCSNNFIVSFNLAMSGTRRSELERALGLLGPKFSACLFTPMLNKITPRLYIHCGNVEDGVSFVSLVQWFKLLYNGPLSKDKLADVQTGFGTDGPKPAQFTLVWTPPEDDAYIPDKRAMNRVLHNLRKEASHLADDANKGIDAAMYVYHWLVNDNTPAIRVDRLPESRAKVCHLIGDNFKALGYKAAMRMYM
jgi:hypothetical protein